MYLLLTRWGATYICFLRMNVSAALWLCGRHPICAPIAAVCERPIGTYADKCSCKAATFVRIYSGILFFHRDVAQPRVLSLLRFRPLAANDCL
jgi:hypothetical protein